MLVIIINNTFPHFSVHKRGYLASDDDSLTMKHQSKWRVCVFINDKTMEEIILCLLLGKRLWLGLVYQLTAP